MASGVNDRASGRPTKAFREYQCEPQLPNRASNLYDYILFGKWQERSSKWQAHRSSLARACGAHAARSSRRSLGICSREKSSMWQTHGSHGVNAQAFSVYFLIWQAETTIEQVADPRELSGNTMRCSCGAIKQEVSGNTHRKLP